jgi:hypothetical protein
MVRLDISLSVLNRLFDAQAKLAMLNRQPEEN